MSVIPISTDPVKAAPAEQRPAAKSSEAKQAVAVPESENQREIAESEAQPTTAPLPIEEFIERNGKEVIFGDRTLEFNYDKDIDRVIVRVSTQDGENLVRQIPPDYYVKLIAQFKELSGVLFNETA